MTLRHLMPTAMIIILLSGCFLLPREEELLAPPIMEAPEISYRTVLVKRGDVEDAVRVTGYFVYAEQYSVSFKSMTGRLSSIDVKYGDIVSKGTVLARLETDNLETRIRQLEIQLRKSELS
ncbi:MAG: efflux RND transporter periplasmic adaptor subunit, partial [Spirochaetales bacterium]|nr:efflux RND transporter periplasmic adaptor subunit [Spirochaetales bacterium]